MSSASDLGTPAWLGLRARWLGGLAGVAVGLADFLGLRLLGVQMLGRGADLTIAVMVVFGATFAALGYLSGRLLETRVQARADAATIREQLVVLKETQAQMLQFEKLASIGRMAAGVAHEVRNPLAVIRSAASLLAESLPPEDADGKKAGRFIQEEVDRLDGFVRSLLDFSRPIAPELARASCASISERVERLSAVAVERSGGSLEVELEPAAAITNASNSGCACDEDLIARVLATLIANACEAAPEVRVVLKIETAADAVRWSVADDGPGVDEEVAARVFEPFVTTKAKGTGLGLAMAARIVEAHGSTLELVEDAGLGPHGRGACFQFALPRSSTDERVAA